MTDPQQAGIRPDPRTVADLGEKRIISELVGAIFTAPQNMVGIGDDAAVLDVPDGHSLVVSTDKIPEDLLAIQLGLMTAKQHGRYLAAVNISDIIAMAGTPAALLLTTCFPGSFSLRYLTEFLQGFQEASSEYGAPVVGGDTGGASAPFFSATALGHVPRGKALLRSSVEVGSQIAVTGQVGGFGAALSYFSIAKPQGKSLDAEIETSLLDVLVNPRPRLDALSWLQSGDVAACMDITDGLGQSLTEFADASACGIEIDLSAVPLHPGVTAVSELLGIDRFSIAFGIGLDLQLLVALRPGLATCNMATAIGRAVHTTGVRVANTDRPLPGTRWQHFAADARALVAGSEPSQPAEVANDPSGTRSQT